MSNCETFQSRFAPGTEDATLLDHLRACDRCLDFAAAADPDVMFRALGGGDLVPPGGVDAFVSDVMRQVRVREAETRLMPPRIVSWPRRLAIAATLVAGITGATLYHRATTIAPGFDLAPIARAERQAAFTLTTKPVVETYESRTATIVEVPAEGSDDVKIVMIFDESLPVDL
ncbi:MAG TPA: hypothetical protein VF701_03740 [Thermoanaerobaculia bacterium]